MGADLGGKVEGSPGGGAGEFRLVLTELHVGLAGEEQRLSPGAVGGEARGGVGERLLGLGGLPEVKPGGGDGTEELGLVEPVGPLGILVAAGGRASVWNPAAVPAWAEASS